MDPSQPLIADAWHALRRLTPARIGLGRSGVSLPTSAHLAFQLAHAGARDAVQQALDGPALAAALGRAGYDCLLLHSACPDRATYLQHPELGRRLDAASRKQLEQAALAPGALALVAADGLSAPAIARNLLPFLAAWRACGGQDEWPLAPLTIVRQGRVAVGDEVGAVLRACAVVVLIGERPGLSAPDSMGLYLSWAPRIGLSDAQRNCISNVRPAGLAYPQAAARLQYLLAQARARKLSGVALKDETDPDHGRQGQAPMLG